MKKILIIYSSQSSFVTDSFKKHIYSFDSKNNKVYYLNFFFRKYPLFFRLIKFDLVIFLHGSITSINRFRFERNLRILRGIDFTKTIKVAFFQDECYFTKNINKFINEMQINYVFSVAPKNQWPKIFKYVDFKKVKFNKILTGYLSDKTLKKVKKIKTTKIIDIGYRTFWNKPYILGSFGNLKREIADIFIEKSKKYCLKINISTKRKDVFTSNKWYSFLAKCKYTIGVESGSSLLDESGKIYEKIRKYIIKYPNSSFKEVEKACFDGLDGNLDLKAISPRHLEACITKTCQILIEGDYNGILKAWKHYIPLKEDFSNIDEVMKIVKEDKLRKKIVDRAYKDIVSSKKYTHEKFVKAFFAIVSNNINSSKISLLENILYYLNILFDKISWLEAYIFSSYIVKIYNVLVRIFSEEKVYQLRNKYKI